MPVLSVDNISKRFGEKQAVDRLSFEVGEGEIFGFLGGNGAGKTTSLRMILDILTPDSGRISVLGAPPSRAASDRIGFLPEERGLYQSMTAHDTLTYFGRLKGLSAKDARRRATALLGRFGLSAEAGKRVADFSKGMAQKVQIGTALINEPSFLILDEPFSGLDPINQALLEDEILAASRGGATVLFSTHIMQHAERLCDRLLILAGGRKRFEGTLPEALAHVPGQVTLTALTDPAILNSVNSTSAMRNTQGGWQDWTITLAPGHTSADLLEECTRHGFALRGFTEPRPTLHDAFISIVGSPPALPTAEGRAA